MIPADDRPNGLDDRGGVWCSRKTHLLRDAETFPRQVDGRNHVMGDQLRVDRCVDLDFPDHVNTSRLEPAQLGGETRFGEQKRAVDRSCELGRRCDLVDVSLRYDNDIIGTDECLPREEECVGGKGTSVDRLGASRESNALRWRYGRGAGLGRRWLVCRPGGRVDRGLTEKARTRRQRHGDREKGDRGEPPHEHPRC
jgi:hypothetical protein